MYAGRSFALAREASDLLGADLWIVSAGLGLVSGKCHIPAYNLTVTTAGADAISKPGKEISFFQSDWWQGLRRHLPQWTSFDEASASASTGQILIGLSRNYLNMVGEELVGLEEGQRSRIRLFGLNLEQHISDELAALWMPYDLRLNGPDSPIPGTMSDFASRALMHYAQMLNKGRVGSSTHSDAATVSDALADWRYPPKRRRETRSNAEIKQLIIDNWDRVGGRSGRMLRLLRDELGVACEQSRFKDLFHAVARERSELEGTDR